MEYLSAVTTKCRTIKDNKCKQNRPNQSFNFKNIKTTLAAGCWTLSKKSYPTLST